MARGHGGEVGTSGGRVSEPLCEAGGGRRGNASVPKPLDGTKAGVTGWQPRSLAKETVCRASHTRVSTRVPEGSDPVGPGARASAFLTGAQVMPPLWLGDGTLRSRSLGTWREGGMARPALPTPRSRVYLCFPLSPRERELQAGQRRDGQLVGGTCFWGPQCSLSRQHLWK